ncbi:hypothetical protein [Nocardia huaxiensis]|uniref:hypothetical protein n=1 Tax=Nocardia huaxiensis TaxID=2755382 RepID=UPI001E5D31E2|nr:hypothetical protein [Nocardia huaxiensis]UFS94824.1 hypothetical protein LPY97_29475 [Nocardia huaxiensis]
MSRCSLCVAALDHCHGTLIEHLDLAVECTEPACTDPAYPRHPLIADCADILGGCACDPRGTEFLEIHVEVMEAEAASTASGLVG